MVRKVVAAGVTIALLAAVVTYYLLARGRDEGDELLRPSVSTGEAEDRVAGTDGGELVEAASGEEGEVERTSSLAPETSAAAVEVTPDPNEVTAQTTMDEETLARAKELVGGTLDEELQIEDYSWESLAHALAHKDERILLAKTMLGEGNYDDAIAMLRSIIADEPGEDVASLAHLMIGIALIGQSDWDGALAEFQTIIENYPRSAAVLEAAQKLSYCSFLTGRTMEGLAWVMSLLEEDPNNMGASLALWRLLSSSEIRHVSKAERERRREICMAAMGAGWRAAEAYDAAIALAKTLLADDRDKMFQLLQEVARYCPDPTIAACAKLELLDRFATWDPAEGIRLGEEILASSADEAIKKQARRWMTYAYMAQGEVESARQMFDQVMSDGWTEHNLGYILTIGLGRANLDEADNDVLRSWLAELSTKEGYLSAQALTFSAVIDDPSLADAFVSSNTLLAIGGALLSTGNYDLAEAVGMRYLEQAGGNDPKTPGPYMKATELIARAKAARGEYLEAAECFRDALDRFADAAMASEWAMRIPEYLQLGGRYDEAVGAYQQIVTQYPDSVAAPRALLLMAETHMTGTGNMGAARDICASLIDEYPDSRYADRARELLDAIQGA